MLLKWLPKAGKNSTLAYTYLYVSVGVYTCVRVCVCEVVVVVVVARFLASAFLHLSCEERRKVANKPLSVCSCHAWTPPEPPALRLALCPTPLPVLPPLPRCPAAAAIFFTYMKLNIGFLLFRTVSHNVCVCVCI